MHSYLICLGSNYGREINISFAVNSLKTLFPSIVFGKQIQSEPLLITSNAMFINQVAQFTSELQFEEVRNELKHLEKLSGRTKEDTASGLISLDIDILKCDNQILKPEDMKRQYIIDSMMTLPQAVTTIK